MKRTTKNILLIICIIIFIYSTYNICKTIQEDKKSQDLNNELKDYISYENKINDNNDENRSYENNILKINFEELKNTNKDIIGWIYSKNEKINYPVAQSSDNEYYLRRLLNGQYNRTGTIFMDYKNDKNLSDKLTILFGHNMKNETMFGTLINYKEQEYYNENKDLYYFTPEKNYKIELFSGFTTDANSSIYKKTDFNNQELEEFINKSDFTSEVKITEEDKIMVLSTCSYEYENSRYILMGKIIYLEK